MWKRTGYFAIESLILNGSSVKFLFKYSNMFLTRAIMHT